MLASLAVQLPAEAVSRMPVNLPISIESGLAAVDFRPWLLEANDVDITRIYLCRRLGSQCYETVWDVNLPAGWRQPKIELLSVYSGANVSTFNPTALQARAVTTSILPLTNAAAGTHKQPRICTWSFVCQRPPAYGTSKITPLAWPEATPSDYKEVNNDRSHTQTHNRLRQIHHHARWR